MQNQRGTILVNRNDNKTTFGIALWGNIKALSEERARANAVNY